MKVIITIANDNQTEIAEILIDTIAQTATLLGIAMNNSVVFINNIRVNGIAKPTCDIIARDTKTGNVTKQSKELFFYDPVLPLRKDLIVQQFIAAVCDNDCATATRLFNDGTIISIR